jgi:hypothetical protein
LGHFDAINPLQYNCTGQYDLQHFSCLIYWLQNSIIKGVFKMNNQGTRSKEETGMLTGMFRDRENTENAYRSLKERGYTDDEINVLMSEDTRNRYWGDDADNSELGNKALEGTGAGGAIGGTLGAILGGVAAIEQIL